MADEVNVKIGGDTSGAEASIKDLENTTKKSFTKMSSTADEASAEVSKAFKRSGIRTEKAIKESSVKARRDFETIKKSGIASANEIRRAHNVMTEKIKRNNKELKAGVGGLSKVFSVFRGNLLAIAGTIVGLGFSIRKAFDFGETAARLKTQRTAFNNFTASVGGDSDKLLAKLTEVSKGTVATSDLVTSAGKALLLGLDPTKVVELLEIARASSKLTGESLTKQFSDVALGTGRASRLILDNLGIMFSQAEASKRAAAALGILESELTDAQRAVGNLNEVIRQGQPIIRGVGKDFISQADVLAKIRARYANLVVIIGQKFLRVLPKVEIAILKLSKRFLQSLKVQLQVVTAWTKILKVFGVAEFATTRIEGAIGGLTKGINFLDKSIDSATKTFKDLDEAEKRGLETSGQLREAGEARRKQTEREEKAIVKKAQIEEESIKTATELQKTQNELLKQSISESQAQLRELEAEVQRASNFAQTILDEIAKSEKVREQAGFDPLERLVDDLRRAEDNFELAAQERAAGNVDRARELTLSAVQAANAILEVGKGAEDESEVTTRQLNKAAFEAEKLVKAATDFAFEMKSAATEAVPIAEQQVADLQAQLKLGEETLKGLKGSIADALILATNLKATLSQDTTATHTQVINTINAGGSETPGFSTGIKLPGFGGGDKILARLEAGERVIKKEASRSLERLGGEAMTALHKGDIEGLVRSLPLPGFQDGGVARAENSVNVNLSLEGKTFPVRAEQSVADGFVKQIRSINVVRGRKKNVY